MIDVPGEAILGVSNHIYRPKDDAVVDIEHYKA